MSDGATASTSSPEPAGLARAAAPGAAALAFLLYLPTFGYGFVNWDDVEYVLANPWMTGFGPDYWAWAFTSFYAANWHPLTWLSLGLDRALWGDVAAGFHVMNAALHAANTGLVVLLTRRLLARAELAPESRLPAAALVGALFACHPLHVESVAWVTERKDVLYALFWLGSLLAWLRYCAADEAGERGRGAYALALGLFALSGMAKPMAVTLPAVLWILDAYPLGRLARPGAWVRVLVLEKLPFFAVSGFVSFMTIRAQAAGGALGAVELGWLERLAASVRALGFYLTKSFAPVGLVPMVPVETDTDVTATGLALAGVLAVTALAVALWRRAPVLAAAWAFFVVTLSPILGIVQVGGQATADRYTYLPLLGPAMVAAAGLAWAWERGPGLRRGALAAACAVVLLLGGLSLQQMRIWSSSIALWRHVLDAHPETPTALYNLAHAYLALGDPVQGRRYLRKTLDVEPEHLGALLELGVLAGKTGRPAEAERWFTRAVESDPDDPIARYNLALALESRGQREAAVVHYRHFLQVAKPHQFAIAEQVRAKLAAEGTP